jgi:UDP-N-acetyl-D-glucosamine dehydrogenase
LDVIHLLQEKGAEAFYHDPYIPRFKTHDGEQMESVSNLMEAVRNADCVVIITDHKDYDYAAILNAANLIFDSRNAMGDVSNGVSKVVKL